jgi:tetratricopeptide (TPR) repeat protein
MTLDDAKKILGLGNNPTREDIQKAYKQLSQKYHPDKHNDSDPVVREVLNEKFQQITDARIVLLNCTNESSSSAQFGGWRSDPEAIKLIEESDTLGGRRQFNQALDKIDEAIRRHPNDVELQQLKVIALASSDRFNESYRLLKQIGNQHPQHMHDPDFLALGAEITCRAGFYAEALRMIDKSMSLVSGDAPGLLAKKVMILLEKGDTAQADQIINRIEQIDPTNPIVQERKQLWNVGGNYVNKNSATNAGCAVCAILECLFDCI